MPETSAATELVIRIVRGEAPPRALEGLGIAMERQGSRWKLDNAAGLTAHPTIRDLAHGVDRYATAPEGERKEWASLVMGASGVFNFEGIGADPAGHLLLCSMLDIALGDEPDRRALELAKLIVAKSK
ncbi:MAG: hypothetical protein SF028_02365 [Candidatus Sumerlaeia bacterium]|nr:hypothetical protein [Candidatus Sumerlaeia bacterium]